MRDRVCRFCRVAALAWFIVGCGGSSSSSSGPSFDITGTWQGTATGANLGTVNITLDLTQVGADVPGTFTCTTSTNCSHTDGTISGTVRLDVLTAGIVFDDFTDCQTFDATVTPITDSMSGTFTCNTLVKGEASGTWTATRQ